MSSLIKGSLLIAIGTFYKIFLTIIIDKTLALKLGVEDFGNYKYGITVVLLLSTFCALGFGSSIIRTIAIQTSNSTKKTLISLSLVIVLFVSLAVTLVSLSFSKVFDIDTPFLLATFFFSLNTVFNGIYSALEKPKLKIWISDILGFTFYLVFLWGFFVYDGNLEYISLVYLFYVILVFLLNITYAKKYYGKVQKKDLFSKEFNEYLNYSTPIYGISILLILSTHLDKLILNLFVTKEQLGLYYALFNLSNLLPLVLTILVFLYLPRISKLLNNGKLKKATLINSYSSKWTMIMASVFLGFIFYYKNEIINFLYSSEFINDFLVLEILVLAQWINVSLGFTGQNLLALGDSKSQLKIRIISFVIGSFALFFGVKYYGNIGAALALLISLLCSNVLQIVVLKRKHNFVGYRFQNLYAFVIILVSGVLMFYIHKLNYFININFLISMVIDLIFFLFVLVITRVLNKSDIKILKLVG